MLKIVVIISRSKLILLGIVGNEGFCSVLIWKAPISFLCRRRVERRLTLSCDNRLLHEDDHDLDIKFISSEFLKDLYRLVDWTVLYTFVYF